MSALFSRAVGTSGIMYEAFGGGPARAGRSTSASSAAASAASASSSSTSSAMLMDDSIGAFFFFLAFFDLSDWLPLDRSDLSPFGAIV